MINREAVQSTETSFEFFLEGAVDRVKQQFADVEDIDSMELKGLKEFKEIWTVCFGKDGYMNQLPEQEREDSQKLIALSYVTAEYAHQHQTRHQKDRKTQKRLPYIKHIVAVARGVAKYRQQAWVIASALDHDIFEDSKDHGHHVTENDFRELYGSIADEHIIPTVNALSEVQTSEREQGFIETLKQVIEKGIENPAVILIKVQDRLDNMRTISAMPKDKQERKAEETYMIYAPLAKRFGFIDEARELAERSIRILNRHRGGKSLNAKIDAAIQQIYDTHSREKLFEGIKETLKIHTGIHVEDVVYPIFEKVYDAVSLAEASNDKPLSEWTITPEFLPMTVNIIVADDEYDPDSTPEAKVLWIQSRFRPFHPLALDTDLFDLPKNDYLGMLGTYNKARNSVYDGKNTFFLQLKNGSPLNVNVYSVSDYHKRITPLSVNTSVDSIDPFTARVAEDKLREIRTDYKDWISTNTTRTDIQRFGNVLHGSFPLFIQNDGDSSSRRQVYQPNHSSYVDIIMRYEDWQKIIKIEVSDREIDMVKEMGKSAAPGTLIKITRAKNDQTSIIHPQWIDMLVTRREQRQNIFAAIQQSYKSMEDSDPQKEVYRQEIMDYGWQRFITSIQHQFIPSNITFALPKEYSNTDEFLFDMGTGKVSSEVFRKVRRKLVRYCDSLNRIVVTVGDRNGIKKDVTDIFYPQSEQSNDYTYVPNLVHDSTERLRGGSTAILTYYFESKDPALENIDSFMEKIRLVVGVDAVVLKKGTQ